MATLENDLTVKHALRLGFMPEESNARARKHFRWFLPDAAIHGDHVFRIDFWTNTPDWERPSYTVDHQGTTSSVQAVKWLDEAIKQA